MPSASRLRPALALLLALAAFAAGAPPAAAGISGAPSEVAGGLSTPWEIVPLPDGRTLVVERPGRIKVLEGPGAGQIVFDGYPATNKFLGLVLHPGYASNRLLYLYVNYRAPDGALLNRIVRLYDDGARLTVQATIFDGIGSDGNHDGGRLVFGPDGKLYVSTGDIHTPQLPQDRQSLNGKILRLEAPGTAADGTAPPDNPFVGEGGNARFVWTYGHRHPQGLAFDADGRLYSSEHGPSGENYGPAYPGAGGRCCRDEVNLIERGANYGWPLVSGSETREGMRAPIAESGTSETWAPADLEVGSDGHLYVPMLRGAHLRELTVCGASVTAQQVHYAGTYGRLRVAAMGPGGLLFGEDGASDRRVRRVPLSGTPPCAAAPPDGGPAATPTPTPTPAPRPTPAPAAAATPTAAPEAPANSFVFAGPRVALERLLRRAGADLRARRLRGLLRSRSFGAGSGGFGAGRVTLSLERGARERRTLATATVPVRPAGRGTATVRPRLGARARRLLRRTRSARLVLRATHRSPGGTRTTATRRVALRR